MSKISDISRLEFIVEMIEDIEFIISENKSLTKALESRIGKHALLMCLMQIGETLHKIKDENIREQLPIKGSYDVRNFIAHDYEGVDLNLIDNILRYLIPELRVTIESLLN
ncbi:MAG: DUF86 domain-containing protein [Epsilonproteobacteria bacterium]|nr:DUF86 domain-containing protein [Campylobacterota bacterium]